MKKQQKTALKWTVGSGLLGLGAYAVYKAIRRYSDQSSKKELASPVPQKLDISGLIPVTEPTPVGGPVHFERKHPNPYTDHSHQSHFNEHVTRGGNGPGERNQIGGRSSGKTPRFK